MPRITFYPLGVTYRVRRGGSIMRAALRAKVPLGRACRGDGVCASCRVIVLEGAQHLAPMTDAERDLAGREPLLEQERYGCQASVLGDVTVTTRYWESSSSGKQ